MEDKKMGCGHCKCGGAMVGKVLVIIGGLNWGLVGVGMLMHSDWNVVHMLLGAWPVVEAIVYILVGLAAIMKIFGCHCKKCMGTCATCQAGGMDKKM
jgi:uncharacterized protein